MTLACNCSRRLCGYNSSSRYVEEWIEVDHCAAGARFFAVAVRRQLAVTQSRPAQRFPFNRPCLALLRVLRWLDCFGFHQLASRRLDLHRVMNGLRWRSLARPANQPAAATLVVAECCLERTRHLPPGSRAPFHGLVEQQHKATTEKLVARREAGRKAAC